MEPVHLQLYLEELAAGSSAAEALKAVQDLEAEDELSVLRRLLTQAQSRLAMATDLSDEGRVWLEEQVAAWQGRLHAPQV